MTNQAFIGKKKKEKKERMGQLVYMSLCWDYKSFLVGFCCWAKTAAGVINRDRLVVFSSGLFSRFCCWVSSAILFFWVFNNTR